jgi:exodeoxyribonuclease V gamma subunit
VTLSIHRAERTDLLADGLAELLRAPLEDPFAREVVVVPARGVERWLTQRLSHRLGAGVRGGDGVCAGVEFRSPHALVAMLLGRERDDPWDPDHLVWPLLQVVDASLGEPWCAALAAHLGHGVGADAEARDDRRNRRYAVARRLAGHLASYAAQRPRLLTDWREGRDTDGAGGELDADLRWQPELWRRLLEVVDAPPPDVRHEATLAVLRSDAGAGLDLPPRLSLFGHTRISATEAELLAALGELRDVHLWLPQVSATLWEDLRAVSAAGPVPRAEDHSADVVGHPLLAALGRDARELQRTLAPLGAKDEVLPSAEEGPVGDATMLGWLQQDLRANAVPDAATRAARVRDEADLSVQVHACHGAARQVDVLREVLVGLLADDPTLEPRDILVMCPDIETYAPLVSAAFGMAEVAPDGDGHPGHQLRVRLADRALTATNPLLRLASTLVELAGGRLTATQVLDLAGEEPVRLRFGFSDDDLDRLRQWTGEAGVRWGLDASHRRRYGLDLGQNTWQAGLDRVLLGVAMAGDDHRYAGGVLPLDDVGSGDVDLAGRLAELVDRLHAFVAAAEAATTVADWVRTLSEGVSRLTRTPPTEAWQVAQFDRELARVAVAGEGETALRLADVRRLLDQRLGGRPTRASFRTGTLTVCTMVPMRSVPHRVVALLGLDDGLFPRATTPDGDDVLGRRPLTGERDVRSEDRQLLLDAVMAATERLVVTYTGAAEHTGAERPPAVPLGELVDALDVTATGATRGDVVVRHPLQPFDARNLVPGELVPGRPFSFDRAALAGARVARETRVVPGPLVAEPLPDRPLPDGAVPEVSLADLKAFFDHPVRAFLRQRLGVAAVLGADELADGVPIDLDALEKWAVGDRLVRDVLSGMSPTDGMTAELLRGVLPPGRLGERQLRDVVGVVQPIVTRALELRTGEPRAVDVDVVVGGVRLTGTVTELFGTDLVTVTYSSLGARQRLRAWIDLLALTVAHPDHNWRSHAVGKRRSGAQRALAGPLDHRAEAWLADVLDTYRRGMREPLPLPLRTGLAYAEEAARLRMGVDAHPDEKAEKAWRTDPFNDLGIPGEDADPWHCRAWGDRAGYDCLTGPPRPDERWDDDERHRLGQYAWRLWSPLLAGAELVRGF